MKRIIFLAAFLWALGNSLVVSAQTTFLNVSVKGKVRDSEKNYFLTTATAVLFNADSTLAAFQITDSYGAFNFDKVKVKIPCYVDISNVGHLTVRKEIRTEGDIKSFDLGVIDMKVWSSTLKEVTIRVQPVTMNGDTLEFNPGAFKMDPNAVVDDMLRKIPNVTVWNDGQITVNGREIRSLMVNGKPFFGGDLKVATQNLPKNVVDKIQVYQKEVNRTNLRDSLMEMNIKLKKGAERGYFGKLTIGGGTRSRFEGDGALNFYSPRMQLSLAGSVNNTNKIANNINTLLANSTFKTTFNDLDYQTNFRLPGENRTYTGGLKFTYDLKPIPKFNDKSTITVDHFYQHREIAENANANSITTLNADRQNIQQNINTNNRSGDQQKTGVTYEYADKINAVRLQSGLDHRSSVNSNEGSVVASDNAGNLTSKSSSAYSERSNTRNVDLSARYVNTPSTVDKGARSSRYVPFDLGYTGYFNSGQSSSSDRVDFVSFTNSANDLRIDRARDMDRSSAEHIIDANVGNLDQYFLGRGVNFLNLGLSARIRTERSDRNEHVKDLNDGSYQANNYLTNRNEQDRFRAEYGLTLSKSFLKRLSDRYERNTTIRVGATVDQTNFQNRSDHDQRNINQNYTNLIPKLSLNSYSHIFGKRRNTITAELTADLNMPTIDQLAPLIDSTQIYHLRLGNTRLRRESIQKMRLAFEHENVSSNNTFSYRLDATFRFSGNKISDSLFISADNRQQVYGFNSGSYRAYNLSGQLRRSFKFKDTDLKFQLSDELFIDDRPTYVNRVFFIDQNLSNYAYFSAGGGYKDLFIVELRESMDLYRSRQAFFGTTYRGTTWTHTLNLNYNLSKRTTISSNLNINTNTSSGAGTIKFVIWNAYMSQRFFKANNVELKFSALDLLHQNTNIMNRFGVNNLTTVTRNSLQQYFLMSLSYYPRNFGKKQ